MKHVETRIQFSRIEWGRNFQNPPDGFPKILAQEACEAPVGVGALPFSSISALYWSHKPPMGFCVSWGWVSLKESKEWSQQTKSKVRTQKMIARITKKYPMFADEFIQDELSLKSDYYAGLDPKEQVDFKKQIKLDNEKLFDDVNSSLGLIVFFPWFEMGQGGNQ